MKSEWAILFLWNVAVFIRCVCINKKLHLDIFCDFFLMIRQYFVIVLVPWQVWDCHGQLTHKVFVILHILCGG